MFYNVIFCIHNISTVFWTVISLRRPDSRFIFLWLYPNTSTRRMVGSTGWGKVCIWFWSSLYISIDIVYTCRSTTQCWNVIAGQNIGGAWRGQFSMNLIVHISWLKKSMFTWHFGCLFFKSWFSRHQGFSFFYAFWSNLSGIKPCRYICISNNCAISLIPLMFFFSVGCHIPCHACHVE